MYEHSTSSTKKRRLDDDPDEGGSSSSAEITRCEELWFDDGNIVLQAETTQFRVHRSNISMHSPSFKDMFLMPQPEGAIQVEDCPVIHVYDRAKDWENLLMAMYNNFKTNRMQKDYPLDRILSLARLGHKYQFDHFRDIAMEYLKKAFPTTLHEWDSCDAHMEYTIPRVVSRAPIVHECFTSGFEIELVNTAMEVGLRSILPALFFVCMRDCEEDKIIHGHAQQDGTLWKLSPHLQEMLLRAKPRLSARAAHETIMKPLGEVDKARDGLQVPCNSPRECQKRSRAADSRMLFLYLYPGAALQKPEDLCSCEPCNQFLHSRMEVGRNVVWNRLPHYFDLPMWGEAEDLAG